MKLNREGKSRILSSSELDILITYLPTNKHKLIAETCRRTAGRISEVCQLKYENVTCNSLFFPKGICKGKLKARNIPVSEDYLVKLHQFKEECAEAGEETTPDSFIFKGRNGSITTRAFMKQLNRAVKATNLQGFSSHGFRRTSLSSASDANIPIRHIAEVSGHSSMAVLQGYLSVNEDQLKKAVSVFA